ncbi:outer membrane protein [Bradyrhizobium canariense]|uniref:Outer membrane immunogenic protein n=1 Tax=Bradyrhizobium canariense TaxID=255045 RepID=A0A1H1QWL7_9BRAD|nr:outer membrane protein [Bradyrhizobium canariense]SDS27735.1 outer membrane immunogenic protein [Bradyrhizobium canariense]
MKNLFLASVAIVAISTAASAADLAPYTKAPAPIINPGVNWSGFYIGAMGGYGWSDHVRASIGGLTATGSTNDINGGFGGGTIGYNWQMSQWVFGLEADAAGADISDSDTALGVTLTEKVDAFGSATGRIGYAVGPALFYAKGGYAWADNKISASAVGFGTVFSESHFHSGWTVGGGLEYMFAPNWSGKVEYMYADYSNETYLGAFVPGGIGFGAAFHTVKAGINYHFGGPVVARY